jgi:cytochrome c-type biogenesis protein CcmH/NrfG
MSAPKPMRGVSSPGSLSIGAALDQNQALGVLLQRLQESRARFAALRELLPEHLRDQVRPGPLDAAGWSLLAPSGAAASKLRQLVPALEARLHEQGWPSMPIRIRVQAA